MELLYENSFLTTRTSEPMPLRSQSVPRNHGAIVPSEWVNGAKEVEETTVADVEQRLGVVSGFNTPNTLLCCPRGFKNPEFCPCKKCRAECPLVKFDKQQRAAWSAMSKDEILQLLVEQLIARAEVKGLRRAIDPLVHLLMGMGQPVQTWNISWNMYRSLGKYLGKLTCRKMIRRGLSLAGLDAGSQDLKLQLDALMFVKVTIGPVLAE